MHILMISDVYFPRINGVSTSIKTFVDSFITLGHSVTLIAPDYPSTSVDGFDVIRIPSRKLPFDPEDRLMSFRYIKALLPELENKGFDLVHIHTPFIAHYAGVFLAKSLGLKVITSYHTFFEAYFEQYLPLVPKYILRGAARMFSRQQCNSVDGVIAPSRQIQDKLLEYGVKKRIDILPTGLAPFCFEKRNIDGFRAKYNIPEKAFLLLYVGRVAFEKNIGFLIDVFDEVTSCFPNVHLLITGQGPALRSIKNLANNTTAAHRIHFSDYLDREDELLTCYQASDCFVFASETETQGLVLLEAMASSIPVVACASMGSKDVLIDGEGCFISPLNKQIFASKIIHLLKNSDIALDLAKKGRHYSESWSAMAKAREMIAFYQDVIIEGVEGELV